MALFYFILRKTFTLSTLNTCRLIFTNLNSWTPHSKKQPVYARLVLFVSPTINKNEKHIDNCCGKPTLRNRL